MIGFCDVVLRRYHHCVSSMADWANRKGVRPAMLLNLALSYRNTGDDANGSRVNEYALQLPEDRGAEIVLHVERDATTAIPAHSALVLQSSSPTRVQARVLVRAVAETRTRGPLNGVDTPTLFATINAVKTQPELARFQFRATNRWLKGTHSRSRST